MFLGYFPNSVGYFSKIAALADFPSRTAIELVYVPFWKNG
jgi:hypothetical protein